MKPWNLHLECDGESLKIAGDIPVGELSDFAGGVGDGITAAFRGGLGLGDELQLPTFPSIPPFTFPRGWVRQGRPQVAPLDPFAHGAGPNPVEQAARSVSIATSLLRNAATQLDACGRTVRGADVTKLFCDASVVSRELAQDAAAAGFPPGFVHADGSVQPARAHSHHLVLGGTDAAGNTVLQCATSGCPGIGDVPPEIHGEIVRELEAQRAQEAAAPPASPAVA